MRRRFRVQRWVVALAVGTFAGLGWRYLYVPDLLGMAPFGAPRATVWSLHTATMTLVNPGFAVGYSDWRGNPLWAVYRLNPVTARRDLPRPRRFNADPRTWRGVDADAYRHSGYQRGHLAPNDAIAQVHGVAAQRATFLMSNITPQKARLNQKVWQRLEEAVLDHFAPRTGELWVTTGPIFGDSGEVLPAGIEVPVAFFKVLLAAPDSAADQARGLAFRVPQTVRGDEPLHEFLVSVDRIEAETGLDLFPELPDAVQVRIEAGIDTAGWALDVVDTLPSRF